MNIALTIEEILLIRDALYCSAHVARTGEVPSSADKYAELALRLDSLVFPPA